MLPRSPSSRRPTSRPSTDGVLGYLPKLKRGFAVAVPVACCVLLLLLLSFVSAGCKNGQTGRVPDGVTSFQVGGAGRHTGELVSYAQSPPVGGAHHPVWQNCGFYTELIRNEHAVHSLEHGAVWITYRPGLSGEQIEELRRLTHSSTHLLVSPYPNLPAPVVASAWGKQIRLQSASDPRLALFVRAYRLGPQTPEPGAPCTGGTGEPH